MYEKKTRLKQQNTLKKQKIFNVHIKNIDRGRPTVP